MRSPETDFVKRARACGRLLGFLLLGFLLLGSFLLASGLPGCKKEEKGEAPPPPPALSPCDKLPALRPPAWLAGLPERPAGHCIDPGVDVRSYGVGAKAPLDSVCTELFDDECELYRTYGLDAVRTLEYTPALRTDHVVGVIVSEFRTAALAFGFFARRVVGDGSPRGSSVEWLSLTGQGALGPGVAFVRRGQRVVELTYVSETDTPAELERKAAPVLTQLAVALAEGIGGDPDVPSMVRRISLEGLDPWAVELPPDGLLGLWGVGPHAVAHYARAAVPHRLACVEAADEAGAKDALRLLLTAGASRHLKDVGVHVIRHAREEAPPEVWYFQREGRVVLGVGQPLGLAPSLQPAQRKAAEERFTAFALRRLREVSRHSRAIGP